MSQTLPLKKVREELSELVARVAYGEQKVVITRFGKPVAALVTYNDYEKIMNPFKRFPKEEWARGFALMDKMRKNSQKYPPEKVEDAIGKAVKEVRQHKRV